MILESLPSRGKHWVNDPQRAQGAREHEVSTGCSHLAAESAEEQSRGAFQDGYLETLLPGAFQDGHLETLLRGAFQDPHLETLLGSFLELARRAFFPVPESLIAQAGEGSYVLCSFVWIRGRLGRLSHVPCSSALVVSWSGAVLLV